MTHEKTANQETVDAEEEKNPFLVVGSKQPASASDSSESIDFTNLESCSLPVLEIEQQLQNIMNCILPPSTWEEEGQTWRQQTSTAPATRMDLAALEERFDRQLAERDAKPFGVCPVRRQLYNQLFDELIRQTTVTCCERGLLLLRVRDEARMSFLAYQTLLESAIAYGLRKAISVENEQNQAVYERDAERAKNKELKLEVLQLQKRLAADRAAAEEELVILEQRMKDENERLLEANKTFKNQLQTILQMEHATPPSIEL